MSLETEIKKARKEIVSDGYEMSVGEVINLYTEKEIIINPDFQRLFRWDISQKTRFIESLLLGIPIPPIFVFQNEKGEWELIDGLQRLSTIFEFAGILRKNDKDKKAPASTLEGTNFLPSLVNKRWKPSSAKAKDDIGKPQQLQIKRARIRVEILKQESDPLAKYELFQRLNTGGSSLSEQEVRNCVAVMLKKKFYEWLVECSASKVFLYTIDQTEYALKKQAASELALRFFVFRTVPYVSGLDVHEYLNDAMIKIATSDTFSMDDEGDVFSRTFSVIREALGKKAFKKWDGNDFKGKFLMSVFEVVATSISNNIKAIEKISKEKRNLFIVQRARELWDNDTFTKNSGAGIRGTTRLSNLLPMTDDFFRP